MFANSYFHVKERVNIPRHKRERGEAGSLKLLFTNKPLMLVLIMGVLSCGRYMFQAGAIHVARYSFYIGPSLIGLTEAQKEAVLQASISKVNTIFAVATAVGMFGTMLVLPKLIKRFSYKSLVIVSCLLGFGSSMTIYFFGTITFLGGGTVFCPCPAHPGRVINVLSSAMIGDALDFMEWKTGRRETGLGSRRCQSFVNKLGNAMATSFIVLMYIPRRISTSAPSAWHTPRTRPCSRGRYAAGCSWWFPLSPHPSLLLCALPMSSMTLPAKRNSRFTR
jgi:Na+/melibiose symporter-like transporter